MGPARTPPPRGRDVIALRDGDRADAALCFAIYREAVLSGAAPLYTEAERGAWCPTDDDGGWIADRLAAGRTWIAETGATPLGFLTATREGHLDLFFVMPGARRTGVAPALYDAFTEWADAQGIATRTTHASHLARAFLERRGWTVTRQEVVPRNGIDLVRWHMERSV